MANAEVAKLVDALPCLPAGRFEVVVPERAWEFESPDRLQSLLFILKSYLN